MRIFIGYDPVETVAYHVLAHSIIQRASYPVGITPVGNTVLSPSEWWRERGPYDSTEFSNARFLVPYLTRYSGWALFMDCDMLCRADIWELLDLAAKNPDKALLVRKHQHRPAYGEKFLGKVQTQYARKNWSSLMLMNCEHPAMDALDPEYVNTANGLELHGLEWLPDEAIGEIPPGWNVLVEHNRGLAPEDEALEEQDHALVHYTQGGPWHGYLAQRYAAEWVLELQDMLQGANPRASAQTEFSASRGRIHADIEYAVDTGRPGDRLRAVVVNSG